MPRRKQPPPPAPPPAVLVVHPGSVFTAEEFRAALKLKKSTLASEVRAGRLKVSKRAGRYFVVGARILEWLAAGEMDLPRKAREGDAG